MLGERLVGLPALRADGSQFPTELTIVAMEFRGEPVFTAFLRDITSEQQAERQRREAVAQIEAARQKAVDADRAKTLFLANMSHEFRTPMAAVVGYGEMLLDPRVGADDRTALVQAINRNGRHLLALINEVLDLSKIEAGQLDLEQLACRLWTTIEEAVSAAEVLAAEQRVTLTPQAVGLLPRTLITDPTRFRQILDNLLSNAVKFSPAGGRVDLRVAATGPPDPRLTLEVEDQGIGIPPEVVSKLFLPFSQADPSTTRRYGGTGLGLSIVWRLVNAMGGAITVRSEPGAGSCFTVTLPLARWDPDDLATPDDLVLESQLRRRDTLPVGRLTGRVLLAEDNTDSRNIVRFFLERAGLVVETVCDGRAALDRTRCEKFDLLLLDMQMPLMDGYAVAATLRQEGCARPIIALTAHAMAGDEEKCLQAGCDAYLTKPVDAQRLLDAVSRHLGRTHPRVQTLTPSAPEPVATPPQLDELVAAYRRDLPCKAVAIERAVADGDLARAEGLAHRLKGSAGMYGLAEVSDTAGLIEEACREGQTTDLITELVIELHEVVREVPGG